jgi:hypothetical protein
MIVFAKHLAALWLPNDTKYQPAECLFFVDLKARTIRYYLAISVDMSAAIPAPRIDNEAPPSIPLVIERRSLERYMLVFANLDDAKRTPRRVYTHRAVKAIIASKKTPYGEDDDGDDEEGGQNWSLAGSVGLLSLTMGLAIGASIGVLIGWGAGAAGAPAPKA